MDDVLKRLADAGLELDAAETLLAEGASSAASDRLDVADAVLASLRARWRELNHLERRCLGATAPATRRRLEALRATLPRRQALSVGAPQRDPEEDEEPA